MTNRALFVPFKAPPLLPEDVFDSWNLATLQAYCQQNEFAFQLKHLQQLLDECATPPVGFLRLFGSMHVEAPYWLQSDMDEDLAIVRDQYGNVTEDNNDEEESEACVDVTLALQHDEMYEFLDTVISALSDADCVGAVDVENNE